MAFKLLTPETVTHLVVHCSASQPDPKIGAADIDRWHRQRGFAKIGYHFVIKTDGTIQAGRAVTEIGAHAQGFNAVSLGICLVGGVDKEGKSQDNFTAAQKETLWDLLKELKLTYKKATILGHRDLPNVHKDCPCWDIIPWAKEMGLQ